MWDYIRRLNTENKMTLFVTTHYLEEADSLCHNVAIIDHGKIKVSGSPGELKQRLGGDVLEVAVNDGVDLTDFFYSVPGVKEVKKTDLVYRIKLPSAEEALPSIFEGISKKGLKITKISFEKPSLDQVFLEVTGRSLRDEESGGQDRVQRFIMRARSR